MVRVGEGGWGVELVLAAVGVEGVTVERGPVELGASARKTAWAKGDEEQANRRSGGVGSGLSRSRRGRFSKLRSAHLTGPAAHLGRHMVAGALILGTGHV